jgi:glycosyltransferase involved in cell wall biosynthesis
MSVVVGITTWNRCDVLPKAIQSALDQNFSPLSVSVFDDHSTDGTSEVRKTFPEVKWESSSQNKGLVFARNKMMLEAGTRYFCSLDDDAIRR